jgi:Golgi to ER traffic protein 4
LQLLAEILRETHTVETEEWVSRIVELQTSHQNAMQTSTFTNTEEVYRLQRLQKTWLLMILKWSSELGIYKYGHNTFHELLANQCWKVAVESSEADQSGSTPEELEELVELQCDAVQHMALAEKPNQILEWLKALPKPTSDELKSGHECPPGLRDMLLTRSILLFAAVENLRDANALIRDYMNEIEERDIQELVKSYTNKDDGMAPSHIIFCCMLVRICEKDTRTGPLFQWLLKSFKRVELDKFHKNTAIQSYYTKIGKIYFNIEPPPSMLRMMEGMMSGMGGGMGGIDPAMMQAALASMSQG